MKKEKYKSEEERVFSYFRLFIKFLFVQLYLLTIFIIEMIVKSICEADMGKIGTKIWDFLAQIGYSLDGSLVMIIFVYNEYAWEYYIRFFGCCDDTLDLDGRDSNINLEYMEEDTQQSIERVS